MTEQAVLISVLILCMIAVVGLHASRSIKIETRIARLASINAKLDLLLKHSGLEYDPYKNLPSEVVDALKDGKKIEAIKRYREATMVGLKEAKDFIEEVQRRGG